MNLFDIFKRDGGDNSDNKKMKPFSWLEIYVISTIPTQEAKKTDPVYYQKKISKKKYIEDHIIDEFLGTVQSCFKKIKVEEGKSSFGCFNTRKGGYHVLKDKTFFDYSTFFNVCMKEQLSVKGKIVDNRIRYIFNKHPNFTHHFIYDHCIKNNNNFHALFILIDIRKTIINNYMLSVIKENLIESIDKYNEHFKGKERYKQVPLIFVKVDMFNCQNKMAFPLSCNYDFDYKKKFKSSKFSEVPRDNFIDCYDDETLSNILNFKELRKGFRYVYMLEKCYIYQGNKKCIERNKSNIKEIIYKFITLWLWYLNKTSINLSFLWVNHVFISSGYLIFVTTFDKVKYLSLLSS